MSFSYKIYSSLPPFAQNIACSYYGYLESKIRFSSQYADAFASLLKSDFYSSPSIARHKRNSLALALLLAKDFPLYPELSAYPVSTLLNEPFDVLASLPILTKSRLLQFQESRSSSPRGAIVGYTSGTTGTPLRLFKDRKSVAFQWAIWYRHRRRFGVSRGDLSVNFTGKPVVPTKQSGPPFWRFNAAFNQYLVSMQHINAGNILSIVGFLNSIEPSFYSGYPSIISEVSRLAIEAGSSLSAKSRPRVVFTGAENIYEYQKNYIQSFTQAVLADQYGLAEGCCNLSQCEYGNYHEDFEFGHIELAPHSIQADGCVTGEIIATSFHNPAMPLLRYSTGDIATRSGSNYRCPCGRQSSVFMNLEGRIDDYIVTPDARRIMRFDYIFKDTTEILEAQVLQLAHDSVKILAVPADPSLISSFELKCLRNFRRYISDQMSVSFEYVDAIPRTASGKFKAVVSNLS